jgi:hypothetical protein
MVIFPMVQGTVSRLFSNLVDYVVSLLLLTRMR